MSHLFSHAEPKVLPQGEEGQEGITGGVMSEQEVATALVLSKTPMDMLQLAVQQNADLDKLKQLMDLYERWEKNEAHKAYVRDMTAFKAHPPKIEKVKTVDYVGKAGGRTNYKYAPLDVVCDVIGAALSKHHLSYRWETELREGHVYVTCIVTHELGHSEKTSLVCDPDMTGNKNPIQAIGSAVTYLQRYTLLALTGLATEEQDSDAVTPPEMDDLQEQLEWIANAKDIPELQKLWGTAYKKAKDLKDKPAMDRINKVKDQRKRELNAGH